MKHLLVSFLLASNLLSSGQSLTLDNTWLKGSNVIFIGVDNKLILRGNVESLLSFQSQQAQIERTGDTLILKATKLGPLSVILKTSGQSVSHEFVAAYLPMVSLVISNDSAETKYVSKEKIEKTKDIYLISSKSDIKLFEDYLVTETVLKINDKTYQSSGSALSEEVKQEIATLKAGSIIKVEQVTAKNRSTGKEMKLRANQNFSIL
jgi:hypothetical protein